MSTALLGSAPPPPLPHGPQNRRLSPAQRTTQCLPLLTLSPLDVPSSAHLQLLPLTHGAGLLASSDKPPLTKLDPLVSLPVSASIYLHEP